MASSPALDLCWRPGSQSTELFEQLHLCLDEFSPLAIQDLDESDGWRVFFRTAAERELAAAAVRKELGERLQAVHALDVADEGWARRSQAGLSAVRIGRIVVAPPWHAFDEDASPGIRIVIDPSTGFGTGHHETTRLCLGILQAIDISGLRAIDVGTGSGVLAIAMAKLDAREVLAIDNDPDALENARDNVRTNECDRVVAIGESDLASLETAPADVVTANLTAAALARHAARLTDLLKPGGTLVVSGFAPDEASAIEESFPMLTVTDRAHEGAWVALALRLLR